MTSSIFEILDTELIQLNYHLRSQIDQYFAQVAQNDRPETFTEFYTEYVPSSQLSKPHSHQCCVDLCLKHRGSKKTRYCWMHKARRFKQQNPLSYIYSKLKYNAGKRGVVFTISLRYFRLFCWWHEYDIYKGRRDNDYNIDRIINSLGYERGNLQILTGKANRDKYHTVDKIEQDTDPLPF